MLRLTLARDGFERVNGTAIVKANEVATAYLPLLYSRVPMTNGQVVRIEVPRTALASLWPGKAGGRAARASRPCWR